MTKHDTDRRAVRYQSSFGPGWVIHAGETVLEILLPGSPAPVPESSDPPALVTSLAQDLADYFAGGPWVDHPELADRAGSTPFTRAVYEVVAAIPDGSVTTYGKIARQLNRPAAARAVGRAMATNPFPVVIPCHRVVGSDGSLTGFGGGVEMKAKMLKMEHDRG